MLRRVTILSALEERGSVIAASVPRLILSQGSMRSSRRSLPIEMATSPT